MFRITRSPDKPMFVERRSGRAPAGKPEAVICTGPGIPHDLLFLPIPHRRALFEPNAARAIACALEGCASCLVMDLSCLDPPALSALVHLRLIRPDLELILLEDATEKTSLRGTVLEGLPVVRTRRGQSARRDRTAGSTAGPPQRRPET